MAEPAPKKHKALDASVQAYIDTNEGTANFWLLAGATGSDDLQIKLPTCRAFVAFHSKLIRDLPDEEDPEFPVLCDHDTSTLVLFLQACQPNFCGLPEYSAGDIGKLSKIAHYFDAPILVDCLFDQLIKLLQKSDNNNTAFTWTSELYEAVFVMKDLGRKFVLLDPSDLDPRDGRSPGGFEIQFAPPHHEHGAALRIHNNCFVVQFPRVFLELDEAARSTLKKHSRSLISFFITKYREGKYANGAYSKAVKDSMLSCLSFVLAEATLPPDVEDLTS